MCRHRVNAVSNNVSNVKLKPDQCHCVEAEIIEAPFTRDHIQMESEPFGSDPLFEGRLHGIGSRTVGVYTGSDPFRFYELLAAL